MTCKGCTICLIPVFLIIALFTYLYGCDSSIGGFCGRYLETHVTVYEITCGSDYAKEHHHHRRWDDDDDGESCGAKGKYVVDGKNYTCQIVDGAFGGRATYMDNSIAHYVRLTYPIGSVHEVYVDKFENVCRTKTLVNNLSATGLAFFVIAAVCVIILLWIECKCSIVNCLRGRRRNDLHHENVQFIPFAQKV